ncbi:hypothetical protein GOV07_04820 [Candidatus Woesearchaeota archaeon]|nr:hypothetical protein [Candidatus Woesearchaeota archaeon]
MALANNAFASYPGVVDQQVMIAAQRFGILSMILPFIFVFTLVYAILHKTKILGEKSKNFNVIISLTMGASVVTPHILMGTGGPRLVNGMIDPVVTINNALPNISIILIAVLMILLIFGVWGSKVKLGNSSLSGIISLIAFIAVIFIFLLSAGLLPPRATSMAQSAGMNSATTPLIVVILVFALIIWWVTKEEDPHREKKEESFGKFFGSILDKDRE